LLFPTIIRITDIVDHKVVTITLTMKTVLIRSVICRTLVWW